MTRWVAVPTFWVLVMLGCGGGATASNSSAAQADGSAGGTVCVQIEDADKLSWTGAAAPTYTCNASPSTANPTGGNACRNDADCAIIGSGMVREITRVCMLSCRSYEPDCAKIADCNSQCVGEQTKMKIMDPGISAGCGACYTNVALCSLAYCLSECAADADAPECVACQFQAGCRLPFERCSGLDRN
jgi:hypothetical protein